MGIVKPRVIHMVTVPQSVGLMNGQLLYLKNAGFDMTVISSPGQRLEQAGRDEGINIQGISMERTISPFRDLLSLIRIICYFRRVRPHICNAGTPKAGLLGMLASWFTNVPLKVYTIRGLPFEGAKGAKKIILIAMERLACACADKVICISPSVRDVAVKYNLTPEGKTVVFGAGSSNGLQLKKYSYNIKVDEAVGIIRNKYLLHRYRFIIGYVGRINNFKGVEELVTAFETLQNKYENIALMLVGKKETKDPISQDIENRISKNPHIIEVGHVDDPIPFYYSMDILAFPTYREGFGNVSIEAQATGTPVVATNATGAVDTVVDGETGFLVNVMDVKGLCEAMERFIVNPGIIPEMGLRAKIRAFKEFDSSIIWKGLANLYKENLGR